MSIGLDPVERARHVAELGFLERAIEVAGYSCRSSEHDSHNDGDNVVPELVVLLGEDEQRRMHTLQLSFIPVGDEMEASTFLQMFVPLPYAADPTAVDDVRRAAAIVNEHLAIGRFGVLADGSVYYRYVLASRKNTMIDDDLIAEIVGFVDFHQEHFGDYVEGVCDGDIAIEVLEDVISAAG